VVKELKTRYFPETSQGFRLPVWEERDWCASDAGGHAHSTNFVRLGNTPEHREEPKNQVKIVGLLVNH